MAKHLSTDLFAALASCWQTQHRSFQWF